MLLASYYFLNNYKVYLPLLKCFLEILFFLWENILRFSPSNTHSFVHFTYKDIIILG